MNKKAVGKTLYATLHVLGFILLYIVLRNFDWNSFLSLFSEFKLIHFLLGFGLLILVYILKAIRWMLINRTFGITITFGTTLVFFMTSGFLSVITPGRLGEFSKMFFIKKKTGVSGIVATSSVVLDRVWDVLILTLLGGISTILVVGSFQINTDTIALIVGFFILSLSFIIFPRIIYIPLKYFTRRKKNFQKEINHVYISWKSNILRLFIPGFLISLLAFLVLAFIPLIFTESLGQEVGIIASVSAVSISNMLSFLPITIAGFGTREFVFTEIWKIMTYSAESALSISTAYFICNYLGSLFLGGLSYIIWFRKHFRFKELQKI